MNEIVSIIISTHQRPPEILKRAIDSVCRQTYKNWELIIVDDCPEYDQHNKIIALITSYNFKIRYIENSNRRGANGSRNIGIENAIGQIIALLDDDDCWTDNHLKDMIPYISNEVGLVYGTQVLYNSKRVTKSNNQFHPEGYIYDELIRYGNVIGGCSIPIFKKEIVMQAGMFDEMMPACQDIDCWIRISKICKIKYIDEIVVYYYVTKGAITSFPRRRIEGWRMLLQKYSESFVRDSYAKKRVINNIIITYFSYGKLVKAFKEYNKLYSGNERIFNMKIIFKGLLKYLLIKTKILSR